MCIYIIFYLLYIYIYIYIFICAYIYIYIYIYIFIYVYIYRDTYIERDMNEYRHIMISFFFIYCILYMLLGVSILFDDTIQFDVSIRSDGSATSFKNAMGSSLQASAALCQNVGARFRVVAAISWIRACGAQNRNRMGQSNLIVNRIIDIYIYISHYVYIYIYILCRPLPHATPQFLWWEGGRSVYYKSPT